MAVTQFGGRADLTKRKAPILAFIPKTTDLYLPPELLHMATSRLQNICLAAKRKQWVLDREGTESYKTKSDREDNQTYHYHSRHKLLKSVTRSGPQCTGWSHTYTISLSP